MSDARGSDTSDPTTGMVPIALVGDDVTVPCADGVARRYLNFDMAASTGALPAVAQRVQDFVPMYSSVHRGAGYKSQHATQRYEDARAAALRFAGRSVDGPDIAILCRNTTEAINHLAYRLQFAPEDTIVTTVVEHHANLLPWARRCRRTFVECTTDGTFTVDDVVRALDASPGARLLALTGASNVTGWLPPLDAIIAAAHARNVPVFVDAAQLAPHRPIPAAADFVAWSGHKMYAPYGTGALIGPRRVFEEGDPFLAGGGAVDLVDLDEVVWTEPPEREEAGSPNVPGAVALGAAIEELERVGWPAIVEHDRELSTLLRTGIREIPGVRVLGPGLDVDTLPLATFTIDGMHHALVAARLSVEFGIGVRHGCFCAHPYLLRLLDLSPDEVHEYRSAVLAGDRRRIPGAVRASAGISTTAADVERLLAAVREIASGAPAPIEYEQDPHSGDYHPLGAGPTWDAVRGTNNAVCAQG